MRFRTYPCEFGAGSAGSSGDLEGWMPAGAGSVAIDTVLKRSPGASYKALSGAGNLASCVSLEPNDITTWTPASGVITRTRFYFCCTNLPGSTVRIMSLRQGGAALVSARLTAAGKLQFWNDTGTPAQIGSDSAATIVADGATWYRVELAYGYDTSGSNDFQELLLDGNIVATAGLDLISSWAGGWRMRVGWVDAPGANKQINFDDGAINDSTGADNTGYPGAASVIALYPVSDSSRVGWTDGAGGATALWDALNNRPPLGIILGSANATSQIKDLAANITDAYVANMTDYTTAGLPAGAAVQVVQAVADIGESGGQASFGLKALSNPAASAEDTALSYNGAAGTWDNFWATMWGAAIVAPTIVAGTRPTLQLRKNTNSGAITQMADLLAMVVEYTPGVQAPVNTVPPVVSGSLTQGSTLSCTQGTWTGSPNSFTYQWQRETAPGSGAYADIAAATAATYVTQAADLGLRILCKVTASVVPVTGTVTVVVNPTGHLTTVYLDYGSDPANLVSTTAGVSAGSGSTNQSVQVPLPTFTANTYTYFRARCVNSAGESVGSMQRYYTPPAVPHVVNVPGDYATVQAAIDACVAGDEIRVAAGSYPTITLSRSMSGIVRITGSGAVFARIYVNGGVNWSIEDGVSIDGHGLTDSDIRFEVQGTANHIYFAADITSTATANALGMLWMGEQTQNVHVFGSVIAGGGLSKNYSGNQGSPSLWPAHHRIVGADISGQSWDVFHTDGHTDLAFIETYFHDPTPGLSAEHQDGIQVVYGNGLIVDRCRFKWGSSNPSGGVGNGLILGGTGTCENLVLTSTLIERWQGCGLQLIPATGRVYNITIYDARILGSSGQDIAQSNRGSGVPTSIVMKNVCAVEGFADQPATITGSNNHFVNTPGNLSSLTGGSTGAAGFTNGAGGDFRPTPASALKATGVSDANTPKWGYDGRGWGSTPPRGAFAPSDVQSPNVLSTSVA